MGTQQFYQKTRVAGFGKEDGAAVVKVIRACRGDRWGKSVTRTASAAAEHAETQRAYLLGDSAHQKEAGSVWCEATDVDFYLLRSCLARALADPASALQP